MGYPMLLPIQVKNDSLHDGETRIPLLMAPYVEIGDWTLL